MKTFSREEIMERNSLLSRLFSAFGASSDPATADAYNVALAEIETDALARSVDQFIKGKVERNSFIQHKVPTTPELVRNCEAWEGALRPPVLQIEHDPEPQQISPEERARMQEKLFALAEHVGSSISVPWREAEEAREARMKRWAADPTEYDPRPLEERLGIVDAMAPAE